MSCFDFELQQMLIWNKCQKNYIPQDYFQFLYHSKCILPWTSIWWSAKMPVQILSYRQSNFRTKLDYRNFLFICIRIFKSPLYISELSTLQECNITSLQILAI